VTEGRRAEFSTFEAFADARARTRIPDPQARSTFEASRLDWTERAREPHAGIERLYRALLRLRRDAPAHRCEAAALGADAVGLVRTSDSGDALLLLARLRGEGEIAVDAWTAIDPRRRWRVVVTTEDDTFVESPQMADIDLDGRWPRVRFARPGAIILQTL
jgi:maltooligosyltrehalose trehalohydrolase